MSTRPEEKKIVTYNGFPIEVHYKSGLIVSSNLLYDQNIEWAGTITDFNEEDIAKLDISRVSSYSWMVYQLLMRYVPHGNLITYGDLAALFGSRGGARAVGTAMTKNPWPILVPCHRVVASTGLVGRYSSPGGQYTKSKLLRDEGLEIGENGEYDQKNLMKIAIEATEARIQTNM